MTAVGLDVVSLAALTLIYLLVLNMEGPEDNSSLPYWDNRAFLQEDYQENGGDAPKAGGDAK